MTSVDDIFSKGTVAGIDLCAGSHRVARTRAIRFRPVRHPKEFSFLMLETAVRPGQPVRLPVGGKPSRSRGWSARCGGRAFVPALERRRCRI